MFLAEKDPDAAARAVNAIAGKLALLARFPHLSPVDPDRPDARQLFIRFGAAGYVVRYRELDDTVTVLAIRHVREAGYFEEPPRPPPPSPSSRRRRS
jgi:plasmid stabilization system protein ParE